MGTPGLQSNGRISVRRASAADSEGIAQVCLMTAYQGRSAELLVRRPELPSQVRALPYLYLPSGFGFVLVVESGERPGSSSESESEAEAEAEVEVEAGVESRFNWELGRDVESGCSDSESDLLQGRLFEPDPDPDPKLEPGEEGNDGRRRSCNVVGYVVGTTEAAQFEREINELWWPALRMKYPKDLVGTPLDRYFIGLIHKDPKKLSPAGSSSASGAAHIHVNVIGKYKKLGYDHLLVDVALRHLRKNSGCRSSSQIHL